MAKKDQRALTEIPETIFDYATEEELKRLLLVPMTKEEYLKEIKEEPLMRIVDLYLLALLRRDKELAKKYFEMLPDDYDRKWYFLQRDIFFDEEERKKHKEFVKYVTSGRSREV